MEDSMANTPHLNIELLVQSQAQKEVTVKEAFYRIDALLNSGVKDKDLTAPPAIPIVTQGSNENSAPAAACRR